MIPRPSPQGATTDDFASLCEENVALRSALMALPAIAEEIRQQWDVGMKSGKLLIALTDPGLRYRMDITQIHEARALVEAAPTMRDALDHPLLRQLFGEIEDSGTPEAARLWAICMSWFDVRDPALALARGAAPDGGEGAK